MEDYTVEQLLQDINELESSKGVCEETDRIADEQIAECRNVLARMREVE